MCSILSLGLAAHPNDQRISRATSHRSEDMATDAEWRVGADG